MALKDYVVLDGFVNVGGGKLMGRGSKVKLEEVDVMACDPKGTEFCLPEEWPAHEAKQKAEATLAKIAAAKVADADGGVGEA